jgi:hypothetical protein
MLDPKIYSGCILYRPSAVAKTVTDLTVSDAERIVKGNLLANKPILIEHKEKFHVGQAIRSYMGNRGSVFVDFQLNTKSPVYEMAKSLIRNKTMLGLSLSHDLFAKTPVEVSLCMAPARPNAYIVNASSTASGGSSTVVSVDPNMSPLTDTEAAVSSYIKEHGSTTDGCVLLDLVLVKEAQPGMFGCSAQNKNHLSIACSNNDLFHTFSRFFVNPHHFLSRFVFRSACTCLTTTLSFLTSHHSPNFFSGNGVHPARSNCGDNRGLEPPGAIIVIIIATTTSSNTTPD